MAQSGPEKARRARAARAYMRDPSLDAGGLQRRTGVTIDEAKQVLDCLSGPISLKADGRTNLAEEFLGISSREIKNFLARKTE